MTATDTTIRCEFDVAGRSSYRSQDCGQPAVSAVSLPRIGGGIYEGRCKRHASVDKRRTYGALEPVELTAEVVDEITNRIAEHRAAVKKEQEARAERQKVATERARVAAWEDALVPTTYSRDDRPGDIDWDAVAALRAAGTPLPDEYPALPAKPRWSADAVRGLWSLEVMLERRAGWPTKVEVRTSSELTLRQAKALRDMLTEALTAAADFGPEQEVK